MKQSIKPIIAAIALLLTINLYAQDGTMFSLQQCIVTAISNNLTVKQSNLLQKSAEADYQQAKASRFPTLSGDIFHGINQGRSIDPFTNSYLDQQINFGNYGLNTNVTLFNGNNISNNIKRNAYNVDATKMDLQQAKDNITLQVILAYLNVLSNEDQLKQNMNQAALSRQQVERLEIMDKDGAISPSQLYDLKGQLNNDELAIVTSQNAVDGAKLSLAQLMNIPFSPDIHVTPVDVSSDPALYDATTKMIYESASKTLGFVKATEYRKLSAQKALAAAKGLLYPSLYLSGGLYTNISSAANTSKLISTTDVAGNNYVKIGNDKVPVYSPQSQYENHGIAYANQFKNNYNTSVGIGIRIPILNGLQTRTRIRQARIDLTNAEYVEETTRLQLQQQIEQASFNMQAAYKRYQTLAEQVASYKESFRVAEIKFNVGAINSVEYLVIKNNLDRANINLIIARYEYLLRTKVLDYYQGKPLW